MIGAEFSMSEFLRYIKEGENKFIEFKREYTSSLLKTICAFANFHDGKIILGITDSQEIIGISNFYQVRLNIENAINSYLEKNFELLKISVL